MPPKSLANHSLTQSYMTILLIHSFWEQAFLVAILPQRKTPSSKCLKGILVIPNSKTLFLFCIFLFFFSLIFLFFYFFLNETKKRQVQALLEKHMELRFSMFTILIYNLILSYKLSESIIIVQLSKITHKQKTFQVYQ